jgi:META domain
MCCPGELASLSFALGKDGVAKVRDEATGRLTLDTIGGGEWVLRSWTFWEPAPAEPAVTLSYADRRLAGTGGCNRYFADAKGGDMPGDLTAIPCRFIPSIQRAGCRCMLARWHSVPTSA